MAKQSFFSVVITGFLGILFFLILVGILNIVAIYVDNHIYLTIVSFVNRNILLLLLISVIIFIANIFEVFIFPFNIVYPIINAVGAVFWVVFIFRALKLVSQLTGEHIHAIFFPFYLLALVLVPVIVLIVGYIHIFVRLIPKRKKKVEKTRIKHVEWSDVGDEFRQAMYNLGQTLRETFEPSKSAPIKKKKAKKKTKK